MEIPNSLKQYQLQVPTSTPQRYRLILSEVSETGSGKSDLVIRSAPDPILIIDLDRNLEGMIEKYSNRDILVKPIDIPPTFDKKRKDDQDRDYKILMGIQDLFMDAVESGEFRTIFLDTADALYELARRGILGGGLEFGDTKRTDFSAVNSWMRSFYDAARTSRVNFVSSLHMRDEFKGASSTGKRTWAGWKGTIQCSQMHVFLFKGDGVGVDKFNLEVMKCTPCSEAEGIVLTGEEVDFKCLGKLAYPDSEFSDWE